MVSPIYTNDFTSPFSMKHYVLSFWPDGRVGCSCWSYSHMGTCKHLSLPHVKDVWAAIEKNTIRPAYDNERVVAPAPKSRPSDRVKLEQIYK